MMLNRKIHRWLSVAGVVFFLSVSMTGLWMQGEEVFGEKEAQREAIQKLVSPISLNDPLQDMTAMLNKARANVQARYGDRPIASVDWIIKAPIPAFAFHLDGEEAIKVTVNAATGQILSEHEDGDDLVKRIHTGEIFGDAGKFLGLFWGAALIAMSVTGALLYLKMMRARIANVPEKAKGVKRFFW